MELHVTCVCICKEEKCGESAEEVTEGPVKVPDVVGDSTWQRQREKSIRQREIHQVDRRGVELLLPLADDTEHQAVPTHADDKNDRVENREEDHCSPLVDKDITAAAIRRGFSGTRGKVLSSHFNLDKK